MAVSDATDAQPARAAFYNDPKVRGIFYQVVLFVVVLWLGYEFVVNARDNLRAAKIATGFGFLDNTAGFSINQTLIPYTEADSYGRVFVVGLLNTLLVAAIGIVLATILGFIVGISRLSSNWLLQRLAGAYVELIRNLPLLFQILFWYLAVLGALPGPRQSISVLGEAFINNRGLFIPRPIFGDGSAVVLSAFALAVVAAIGVRIWARRRQEGTGQQFPVLWTALGLVVGVTVLAAAATGFPISFEAPVLRGFNFAGGMRVIPEFVALLIALVTYTAAFIAEIVRAGILAVSRGQTEAAYSLGLRPGQALRLVVVPQALRVIIPPLTSQYLNLTKNSSLAVAIGYPDLFAVFAGTTLNQTGQAIEIIVITMAVYLTISLVTSLLMNLYNARVRLVER
ncbi:MAG TPA: amino acid ABC transporter permease [Xanthobacteraceae bacterium]|nr:amino acid ABC transporter permease [Xanthobacteraceae bacterium]